MSVPGLPAGLAPLDRVAPGFAAGLGLEGLTTTPLEVVTDPSTTLPPDGPLTVRTPLGGEGVAGEIVVLIGDEAAERVVYAAEGTEDLLEALVPALTDAITALATATGATIEGGDPAEHPTADTAAWASAAPTVAAAKVMDGAEHVATIVLAVAVDSDDPIVDDEPTVDTPAHDFPAVEAFAGADRPAADGAMALLRDVEMDVTAELGRTRMTVQEILGLLPGSIVELDRIAGTPVDLLVNGTLIARGEVVVIDEEYGVRVTEIVTEAAGVAS